MIECRWRIGRAVSGAREHEARRHGMTKSQPASSDSVLPLPASPPEPSDRPCAVRRRVPLQSEIMYRLETEPFLISVDRDRDPYRIHGLCNACESRHDRRIAKRLHPVFCFYTIAVVRDMPD